MENLKKSLDLFDKYYVQHIKDGFKTVSDQELEIDLFGDKIVDVIKNMGSWCYYFLDDHDLHVSISWNVGTKKFYYYINEVMESQEFNTRKECENHSIQKSFEQLEKRLCQD